MASKLVSFIISAAAIILIYEATSINYICCNIEDSVRLNDCDITFTEDSISEETTIHCTWKFSKIKFCHYRLGFGDQVLLYCLSIM
jgi:hypothetical protein